MFSRNTRTADPTAKQFNYTVLLIIIFLTSCSAGRNLSYFSDLGDTAQNQTPIQNSAEPKIQPDDLLGITVSSMNAETNLLFNGGVLLPSSTGTNVNSTPNSRNNEGYLVDSKGEINFPVIGKVKLGGLTKEEATDKITSYVGKSVKSPIVTVRYLNFRITVIGEVNRPSTFTVPTEKINVLEALGLAGDMTGFGRRDDVLIIREQNNVRTTTRINLNNKAVLNSPFFYLQQNDIVYVEPDKAKALQVSTRAVNLPIYISIASIIVILLVNIIRVN